MYALFTYRGHPPMLALVCRQHPDPFVEAASGRPALVTVTRAALPWHGLEGEMAGDPYDVVVAGLDGETAWLDDEAVAPRSLPLGALGLARGAHRKSRYRLPAVTGHDRQVDPAAAVRDAVRATHHHLTEPVLGNAFDVNFGLSGIGRLAKDLADTRTAEGWFKRGSYPRLCSTCCDGCTTASRSS